MVGHLSFIVAFASRTGLVLWDAEVELLSKRCGPNVTLVPHSVDWNYAIRKLPEHLGKYAQPDGHSWTREEGVCVCVCVCLTEVWWLCHYHRL